MRKRTGQIDMTIGHTKRNKIYVCTMFGLGSITFSSFLPSIKVIIVAKTDNCHILCPIICCNCFIVRFRAEIVLQQQVQIRCMCVRVCMCVTVCGLLTCIQTTKKHAKHKHFFYKVIASKQIVC